MVERETPFRGISILVVDDEASHLEALRTLLERQEAVVFTASSGELALRILRTEPIQLALVDLMMPGLPGLGLLKAGKLICKDLEVVVMTAYGTIENAVQAMREGAYDFIQKPLKTEVVTRVLGRALERILLRRENLMLRQELAAISGDRAGDRVIIGRSPAMLATMEIVRQAAPSDATVLLEGESGTGKELLARALHEQSPRIEGPFVAVNCAALPESILESELFGHERGAFTGAVGRREGRFERAHGGTLFLDEVGELPSSVQAKLLRVLQEGELERVGGQETIKVDFRLVAATNRDLDQAVRDGEFREDLYYRLNVIAIRLPALRERPEDIPLLADHFLSRYAQKNRRDPPTLSAEALAALVGYEWPGNIRELENVIERAVVLSPGRILDLAQLPEPLRRSDRGQVRREGSQLVVPVGSRLDQVEALLIRETLKETRGDKTLAAQLLGIAPRTIYRRLESDRASEKEPR
jgi:two-component system, NtrC family, response regulator HydG